MSYSLSFASDEEAFTSYFTSKQPDARMQQQLHQSQNQLRVWRDLPLPSTMEAALAIDDRAVVITEAKLPFKITHVNEVWEGLCGFSAEESKGKTLSMLQGEETNLYAITNMMNVLMQGNEAGCVLTNYTKEGRRFRNHLRVRPLDGPTPRFVGILQEIRDGM
mmetsp:Transcript_11070/g.15822  ORF Transcript_11070/g.15822 Transcript_11070/m.15822 type:complete len:163 (+) Transcript_11070:94-582(+)|eukprot:CAMPEP_0202457484 /NCGR_PEP_ID=MMETSP1360-20130828/14500_1 /ASSEMBLY_ACC=CAM_ASM_000848 /TAXON_ID=515479 /ORGANISM="Licmophora paradoxa, Strain CCMP2313" /LENGTH=162 /DNA_ID=CAMNT_0049077591 /DNA_START=69 /DNA_END=557 /DNA_ORIENTATION=-